MDYEMQPLPLDSETADRLLAGCVAAEDAPPGYGPVVRVLEAASAEPSAEELEREAEAVAAIAAAVRSSARPDFSSPRRFSMPSTLSRARLVAAALAAALASTAALASAGSLPLAAQDVASEMLAKVGISVPGATEDIELPLDVRGDSGGTATTPTVPTVAGQGSVISELATGSELTGLDKGAAVSTAASDGKSQAGQHPSTVPSSRRSAPVTTPNGGGTGTADTASGGQSSQGTATADTASGGKPSAGSGNADSGSASSAGSDKASTGQETADSAGSEGSSAGQSRQP